MRETIDQAKRPGFAAALPALLVASVLLAGCASSQCVAPAGLSRSTPLAVVAGREHLGERVRWGGRLAEVRHLRDSTEIEVVALPLDGCGRPREADATLGRFVLVLPGFVETAARPPGSLLSATGLILGLRDGRVGEADLGFPLLDGERVRWWSRGVDEGFYEDAPSVYRPRISIGIGGGSGGIYGGGIGIRF